MLRTDISQFYPSLYTHAVGWAIDSKLRQHSNWRNVRLLGKRIDQLLMNMQGKISQGVPIGNDVSFLLAEVVLGQVDRELSKYEGRAFRWYDDYEIACDSRADAEVALANVRAALAKFNLRLNPKKTMIVELPVPSNDGWQQAMVEASRSAHIAPRHMVRFFDAAFELRAKHPDEPLLLYAIGLLFRVSNPSDPVLRVAESCITQAVLAEPGCAQKAFALLTFWMLNKVSVSKVTIGAAVERIILRHESIGASSDVSWALAFCIDNQLALSRKAGKVLSNFEDDCIAIQAMHAHSRNLIPAGFSLRTLERGLKKATLDGPHWLALYESVRHGFLPALANLVKANPLFSDMLTKNVSFYRLNVPTYSTMLHPGGAPHWVVQAWLEGKAAVNADDPTAVEVEAGSVAQSHVAKLIRRDAGKVAKERSVADIVAELLNSLPRAKVEADAVPDKYA